ncbi:serine/arginine-rich splicing factor 7-like [Harmonia axyridis]|uniref:serine/arginine-rich splicing factor 7-like n=1 Tax=Harmonia axyridis TaxID=115357 RepID=UPI001E276361|nr:serine/arginine-rich splicing factor 7-like [Harmonia axyridis]
MSRYNLDCKVYVGDLGNNASKQELEDAFGYYGPLRNVWVARNPPGFAFVEFEDARDAEDAVRGLDGRTICGRRARVELSSGKSGGRYRGPPPRSSRGRPFHPDDRCYGCGDRGHYARDCTRQKRGGGSSRRRSRSRSRSRGRYRRSRSRSTKSRSRSRNRSRSRSQSAKRSRSRSPTNDKRSRTRTRSRSRSAPKQNGDDHKD